VLILVLIVLGVRGCVSSRRETALKDYNRDVTSVIQDSDQQVSRPFFELMSNGGREGQDLQVQVNQLRLAADEDVKRAEGFDVPGAMRAAHDNLLLVLNLRAGALRRIADQLPSALGRGQAAENAIEKIAGQNQAFLASDVIHSQRVAPLIAEALDDEQIGGQKISGSEFLPDLGWLSPSVVASNLGKSGAASDEDGSGTVAPGLHGHGLATVTVGDNQLSPAPAVNRVPAGSGVTFAIAFQNQGENDEREVRVTVRVRGAGQTINAGKTLDQTKAGSPAEVSIPLGRTPPVGQATTVDVAIRAVPGEKKTDNNRQSYTVIFTR